MSTMPRIYELLNEFLEGVADLPAPEDHQHEGEKVCSACYNRGYRDAVDYLRDMVYDELEF